MKKALRATNDFINAYPMVAISIVCALFVAIWWFFLRRKDEKPFDRLPVSGLPQPIQAYRSMADQLYEAMEGNGTLESVIRTVIDPLSTNELKAVYNEYGIRKIGNAFNPVKGITGDLVTHLQAELGGDDLEAMALKFASTGLWGK